MNEQDSGAMSRIEFLRYVAGLGLSAAATTLLNGCGIFPPNTASPTPVDKLIFVDRSRMNRLRIENQQIIPAAKDKPLMGDNKFDSLSKALISGPSPLLRLIGTGANNLWLRDHIPAEFADIADAPLAPLVVTIDQSLTSLFTVNGKLKDRYEINFIDSNGIHKQLPFADPAKFSIHLGIPEFTRKEGPLVEGCFLAKETMNLVSVPAIAHGLVSALKETGWKFEELSGESMDVNKEFAAGMALLITEASDQKSDLWKLFDGLPIALVGTQISIIKAAKPELAQSVGLMTFSKAYDLLQKPVYRAASDKITQLVNNWVSSGSPYPPADYVRYMLDADIVPYIFVMQKIVAETPNDDMRASTFVKLESKLALPERLVLNFLHPEQVALSDTIFSAKEDI